MKSILFFILFFCIKSHSNLIYTPALLDKQKAKIVVVIHGCLQSSEAMALGTGWNKIADKNNLVIIYPQVPEGENSLDCWNWYSTENQNRNSKILKSIINLIANQKRLLAVSNPPVFVTGMSSGGALASTLLACYPEFFTAGAIHSGVSYGLAENLAQAQRVLMFGPTGIATSNNQCQPPNFNGRLLVIHGKADKVVNPLNANRIIEDFKNAHTQLLLVDELDHSWPGFTENLRHKIPGTSLPFFSKKNPNSTAIIWKFFEGSILSPQ